VGQGNYHKNFGCRPDLALDLGTGKMIFTIVGQGYSTNFANNLKSCQRILNVSQATNYSILMLMQVMNWIMNCYHSGVAPFFSGLFSYVLVPQAK